MTPLDIAVTFNKSDTIQYLESIGKLLVHVQCVVNPRRMREGYGTQFVVRSVRRAAETIAHLKLGKGMNRLSSTMACNVTRGFC